MLLALRDKFSASSDLPFREAVKLTKPLVHRLRVKVGRKMRVSRIAMCRVRKGTRRLPRLSRQVLFKR
jgi:hypothetical protein